MFRRSTTAALVTALLVASLGTPVASAGMDPSWSMATRVAVSVAENTWGQVCGGRSVLIQWGLPTSPLTPPGLVTLAWAGWTDSTGVYLGDAGLTADHTSCRVLFDSTTIRLERLSSWRDWSAYCTTMVHEYGHLAGHEHSTDTADVMYPIVLRVFPACRDAARWRDFTSPRHPYRWVRGRALHQRLAASTW
jgi:hypothetical protein